jgi:multidrug efflux system membrane fusion protein
VWFNEGDPVAKGQTLFSIDARQYEAALRQSEAQLARNEALIKKAEIDVTRYEKLVQQDYVTKEQYDQITTNVAALKAQIDADRATVDNARLQVAYCTISAPMAGRTGSLSVKVGNLVRANDDKPLVTINQTRPIYVSFTVPAQVLPQVRSVREGTLKVTATLPENAEPREGVVTFIDNNVDTATSTIVLKGTFANADEQLWPGQFVDVMLYLGEEPDRVVAPAAAIQAGQQGQYVFVVKPDGTAEQRLVKVNRSNEKEAVIDAGLSGGETVVVDGHLRVVPGGKVVIRDQAK